MPLAPESLLEHAAFVRSVARATLGGDDLADDVVQDTMLAALEAPGGRRGPLRAWLAGVARHKARDVIRRRVAARRREKRAARAEATDGVDELTARAEEGRRLVASVLALDELYRKPILLRYYEGLPPREIARRLDVPVETARTRIKRGIDTLRDDLEQRHEQEPGGWRTALLLLLEAPSPGTGLTAAVLTGGTIVGKKALLWTASLLVLVGGGLWLRPWEGAQRASETDPDAMIALGRDDEQPPRLQGATPEDVDPSATGPASLDLARVDRERDLHGVVVRTDGAPVGGAKVTARYRRWLSLGMLTSFERLMSSTEGPSTSTAADGSFALRLGRGDLVSMQVTAPGLATTERTDLQAGERVRVVLEEGVRLVVIATDAGGDAVEGMPLRCFVNAARTGYWVDAMVTTDADGRAVLEDLPPGLQVWIDPQPDREGLGDPGWVELALPSAGELVHRLELPLGRTLSGRVLDAGTGEGIEGARVAMNWAFLPSIRTDAAGAYALHGWTAELGDRVHASAVGYVPAAATVTDGTMPDLLLTPGRTLRGRIVDADGEPVPGTLVALRRIDPGRTPTPCIRSGVADAAGRFEVSGLGGPALLLVALRPGFGRLVQGIEPGAHDDLGDLVLPLPCAVAGTLTDPAGTPLARVQITLTPSQDFGRTLRRFERWTDDLGRFRFPDLGPGAYDVLVGSRSEPTIRQSVEVTLDRPEVDLALVPEGVRSVVVRAVDTLGAPVAGVYFQAAATDPDDRKMGQTGEDGLVTFELQHRPYELRVVPTVGLGFAQPAPTAVGASQIHVEVVLERLATIRGRLLMPDDQPIAFGYVKVEGDGENSQWVPCDKNGAFVAYVSSGARVVLAFDGLVQEPRSPKQAFIPYTARLPDVAAGTDGLDVRTIPLDMDRELTVRLLDPTGTPVADVALQIFTHTREYLVARTGTDGRAHWSGLAAQSLTPLFGSWRATREQPWLEPRFERVTPEGQELTVQFRQGAVVEGIVLGEDGSPRAWAGVLVVEGDRSVRSTLAGEDGRFVAILDPEWTGKVGLRIDARGLNGEHRVAVAEDVQPGQHVTLRLEKAGK